MKKFWYNNLLVTIKKVGTWYDKNKSGNLFQFSTGNGPIGIRSAHYKTMGEAEKESKAFIDRQFN